MHDKTRIGQNNRPMAAISLSQKLHLQQKLIAWYQEILIAAGYTVITPVTRAAAAAGGGGDRPPKPPPIVEFAAEFLSAENSPKKIRIFE